MDKHEIITRLNEITSYFSFGRILGYISFFETVGIESQLKHGQESNRDRLLSTEIDFLCGLWLQNVNLAKNWDIIKDEEIRKEVYGLMDDLHNLYRDSQDFGDLFVENYFYEGDLAYNWQYIKFAKEKYNEQILSFKLREEYEFDTTVIESTFNKIITTLENQIRKRINEKRRKNEYVCPLNLFTIKPNKIRKIFSPEEQNILKRMSYKLGDKLPDKICDITDYNYFKQYPIIKLPDDRGLFIVNTNSLAAAINETPYYWLSEYKSFHKKLADLRGRTAEDIVYKIIKRRFHISSYNHILIKRSKSSDPITDIDAMLCNNEMGIVFQVKSKRLTELSKRGCVTSIKEDYQKAVTEAFNQGLKCIECLNHASEYYSLRKADMTFAENLKLLNVCITLDSFPGMSSLNYLNQPKDSKVPVIAMSVYELDIIFYLFQSDSIMDYFKFRSKCAQYGIYGLNEIYYIGAYISDYLGEGIKLQGNKICREYALYVDYLVKKAKHGSYCNKDIDCDIHSLVNQYPINSPITCK